MDWVTTTTILDGLRDESGRGVWDAFVLRFRDPVIAFARRLGLPANDAEEVAQETLLAFVEGLRADRYQRTRGRLSRWLFGIAYRQALRQRTKNARREVTVGREADERGFWAEVPDEATASSAWDLEWEQSLLAQCLEQVRREAEPQSLRAFELVVREERSAADAAGELGVPIKAIYNAKHRVLKRLRELRQDMDDDGSG